MAYLFISKLFALFIGHFFDNAEHKHHAIQLCMEFKVNLKLYINNKIIKGNTFLIAPDCSHKIIRGTGNLFLLFLDPETNIGKNIIKKYLKLKNFIQFDLSLTTDILTEPITVDKIKLFVKNIFKEMEVEEQREMDPRIIKIFDIIEQNPLKKLKIPEIAKEIYLSESRMQHLFKDEVGIPIRKYLLWKRIGNAIQLIQENNDLTYIAYESGFSDSAHFSRTFKEMFGVRLKDLFKTAGHVKVFYLT